MAAPLRIGNGQGFWGDSVDAPARLVAQAPDLDYLTLDYLAEVSLSILAVQRDRDSKLGYARDFLEVLRSLAPFWKEGRQLRVVANAGGLNPRGCAEAAVDLLRKAGCPDLKVALVTGDDVLPLLQEGVEPFANLDSGEPLAVVREQLTTANAYVGAQPLVEALQKGADIVITGRVADPSLTVAPCVAHHGWSLTDYDRIAGATIAGHLIECGAQVTGGLWTRWLDVPDPTNIGFPIVEVAEDGSCVVTKPAKTGGVVNAQTVKEQLLYEMGDPGNYLSPDARVSLLELKVMDEGNDRVRVSGAKGAPPPPTLKVSATYRAGYRATGMLTIFGRDAVKKARKCGAIVLARVEQAGYRFDRSSVEVLGAEALAGGATEPAADDVREVVLRVSVADSRKEAIDRFAKEMAPLVTSGPQGTTGYAEGRPKPHAVFGYWPCLIEAKRVPAIVEIL